MLQKAMKDLRRDHVVAKDGRVGSVEDLYFDDRRWAVRYLVVDTGDWLPGRLVLISPASIDREARNEAAIPVRLTREQVKNAPGAESDKPVSRQFEQAHADYYGYPYYWDGLALWGAAPVPMTGWVPRHRPEGEAARKLAEAERAAGQSHLRSSREVVGYHIAAADGPIGHVEDFVVNDADWSITDMIVDTRDWLPGKHVLVAPSAVESIDWDKREVRVRLTREEIKNAPRAD